MFEALVNTKKSKLLPVPRAAALFHVTHWRAGSQWMLSIFKDVFGADAVVEPQPGVEHVLSELPPGKIYPCAYIAKVEYDFLNLPTDARRVVLIRDLRDTLVSLYSSVLFSHAEVGGVERWRWFLRRLDREQGLLYLMERGLNNAACIQHSWLEAGEPVMRLEEFMSDPAGAFRRLFDEFWRLDIAESLLEEIVSKHSFERYSGGRRLGQENIASHYRKGVHGDWRQHFTPKVVTEFKERYGRLLIRSGYEKDDSWGL